MTPGDPLERWVARVNQLGRKIDETAETLHPSAWREILGPMHEQYTKLAGRTP